MKLPCGQAVKIHVFFSELIQDPKNSQFVKGEVGCLKMKSFEYHQQT